MYNAETPHQWQKIKFKYREDEGEEIDMRIVCWRILGRERERGTCGVAG